MAKRRCQICRAPGVEAEWSWQPWGPGDEALTFTLAGSHYRGFPAIPICSFCKEERVKAGETVTFTYRKVEYRCVAARTPVAVSLWDGGTTVGLDGDASTATMLCRDTPTGHEIVALVSDPHLASEIVAAMDQYKPA